MRDVLQSTARKFKIYMADSSAPTSGKTGLSSFTVYLAKDGLSESTVAPSITERGHGWYEVTPTTAMRDTLGENAWTFVASGAVDFVMKETVVLYDSQLAAVGANTTTPPTVGAIANQVWDEARSGHVTAGTFGEKINAELDSATRLAIWNTLTTETFTADSFGDLLIISDGTNGRAVKVTGAHHVAADVHECQADGLTASTEVTNIQNASGYLLAVLAGACADPQTASETYAITVFGSTFTVDMAGQTSTGARTAPTLTKS